jgi:UDP-2,3-diacylglucosamine hydrolase
MILFISDLHLSPERPDITDAFIHFLKSIAKEAEALYILGDLFDAWIGDDDDSPEYQSIIDALKTYSDTGCKLFFMHGNRDFLIGKRFEKSTGAKLLQDPTVITLNKQKTLLMHGDSLCTKDEEYMAFRQMVRNPEWQTTMLEKSLKERKSIAVQLRETSQSMNSIKAEDIMDVTPEEVVATMQEYKTPLLIHGHTHRPARHQIDIDGNPVERIVLGDWHDKGWYLISSENKGIELVSFPISSQ